MTYYYKTIFFATFMMVCLASYPQLTSDFQATNPELEAFNTNRLLINKAGMITLGTWALGNFIAGGVGWHRNTGSGMYFHQGNVLWNTVNFGLAAFGLYGAVTADPGSFGIFETIREQFSLEKLLLFNAGLDIGYMATGFFLQERAKHHTKHADKLKGYGRALILQGAFLFVFDMVLFAVHNHHARSLEGLIPVVHAGETGLQLGLAWHF